MSIQVRLNGRDHDVDRDLTVQTLLQSLDLDPHLIVVELNRVILERHTYANTPVTDGDQIELVHFVGGG
jgi:thiamine biosynthesis protein ThiS